MCTGSTCIADSMPSLSRARCSRHSGATHTSFRRCPPRHPSYRCCPPYRCFPRCYRWSRRCQRSSHHCPHCRRSHRRCRSPRKRRLRSPKCCLRRTPGTRSESRGRAPTRAASSAKVYRQGFALRQELTAAQALTCTHTTERDNAAHKAAGHTRRARGTSAKPRIFALLANSRVTLNLAWFRTVTER
jgi:hypothetical protein